MVLKILSLGRLVIFRRHQGVHAGGSRCLLPSTLTMIVFLILA